jgi:triosephosphate isomerase
MDPQTLVEARRVIGAIKRKASQAKHLTIAICPPNIFLAPLAQAGLQTTITFGVQDIFWAEEGSFTGEVSAEMAKAVGAQYAILGHSERRALGETNEMVAKKLAAAFRAKLTPVLCIGESVRDTDGAFLEFLKQEIIESLSGIEKSKLTKMIIAYEPIWAIGKSASEAMTSRELHETALYIKKVLSEHFKTTEAMKVPILYGGSAAPVNTKELLETSEVSGLLVGRASRNIEQFGQMIKIAESLYATPKRR